MHAKPEILAPVGSREALTAAVENGADAVYLGGKLFSARQYAENFTTAELADAIRFAHLRGVKVYVAVNTLVDNGEYKALAEYLKELYELGADGCIVQDLGVARLARTLLPDLPLHASTQMTIHNVPGAKFLEELGFSRVVLARELTLDEIREIVRTTGLEVEVFIHGALCICYSGQCLMSSLIGGRSGNRGRCAQPCRLPYTLVNQRGVQQVLGEDVGEYLLSPKDLETLALLPRMVEAGIKAFKIEGRMKRPEYVATVVKIYRRALDRYLTNPEGYYVFPEEVKELAQIFNRDFTTGYLTGARYGDLISSKRPNNRGVFIGRVVSYNSRQQTAVLKLEDTLQTGDGLAVWVSVGGRVGVVVQEMWVKDRKVTAAAAGDLVTIPLPEPARAGDRVFKTHDARLVEQARATFTSPVALRRVPVKAEVRAAMGQPLTITLTDDRGRQVTAATAFCAEPARTRPLTKETVAAQVDRMGNTPFAITDLVIDIDGQVMVPVSEINAARREAARALETARLREWQRPPVDPDMVQRNVTELMAFLREPPLRRSGAKPQLAVSVGDLPSLKAAVAGGADWVYFGGEVFGGRTLSAADYRTAVEYCHARNRQIMFATPRIVKGREVAELEERLRCFSAIRPDGVAVSNPGTFRLARECCDLPLHGDFPLNVFNNLAVDFWAAKGLASLTLSPELTFTQIETIAAHAPLTLECLAHGRIPLMISQYCLPGSFIGRRTHEPCTRPCRRESYLLKDRLGESFPIVCDQFCRMHILNAKELSLLKDVERFRLAGVARIRLEAKYETPARVQEWTKVYRAVLDHGEGFLEEHPEILSAVEHRDVTRGHYYRGVL